MKKILLAALAIAAMASCSKNETTDDISQKGISFGVVKGNSVETKAATAVPTNVSLGVYAYNNGVAYDGITNLALAHDGTNWTLPSLHYYPADGTEVKFLAYAPHGDSRLNIYSDFPKGLGIDVSLTATDKNLDVWITSTAETGSKAAPGAIVLKLSRIMSQIKFQAHTTDATNFKVKIKEITVNATKACEYQSTGQWGPDGGALDFTSLNTATEITSTTAAAIPGAASLNMIPCGSVTPKITIVVDIYNADGSTLLAEDVTSTIEVTGGYARWEPGKAYTYNIKIDPTKSVDAITFGTPTVENWTEVTPNPEIDVPTPTVP